MHRLSITNRSEQMDLNIDPTVCAYICWTLNIITVTLGACTIVRYYRKG